MPTSSLGPAATLTRVPGPAGPAAYPTRPAVHPTRPAVHPTRPDGFAPGTGTSADPRPAPPDVSALDPAALARLAHGTGGMHVPPEVSERLSRARVVVDGVVARGEAAYGVTRGLGPLRDQEIPPERQADFQTWALLTHAAGVGEPLDRTQVRAVLAARLAGLAQGGSGLSPHVFDALHELLRRDVVPFVPAEGSVGAADLAPLAAVALVLVGRGQVLGADGRTAAATGPALAAAGLAPVALGPKDALALIGANAASVGLASLALERLALLAPAADLAAAATVEALTGNVAAFDAAALAARPHPGQVGSGRRMRAALTGGDLAAGVRVPALVQDAVSVRTAPQVHGVLDEQVAGLDQVLRVELGSAADNPVIDPGLGTVTSNGNFSALRLAVAVEGLRLVLAHVGMVSERRASLLVARERLGSPLADQLAAAHGEAPPLALTLSNTAAALRATLQQLAAPVSVFGVPVAEGVEDHTAQAYAAVRLLARSIETTEQLLGIEALVAARIAEQVPGRLAPRVAALLADVRRATGSPTASVGERAEAARSVLLEHAAGLAHAVADPLAGPAGLTDPRAGGAADA